MNEVILRNTLSEQYLCAAKKTFTMQNNLSYSDKKTVIVHFSDIHGDQKAFGNVLSLIEHIRPSFAVHTGDVVTWNASDGCRFFYDGIRTQSVPIFNTVGNHDTFYTERTLSEKELYENYVLPLGDAALPSCGIVCEEKPYYYTDFEKDALRLIVLCPYDHFDERYGERGKYTVSGEQALFLCRALQGAKEKNLGVLIALHELSDSAENPEVNNPFCQRFHPYPWGGPPETPAPYIVEDIVDAFIRGERIQKSYTFTETGHKASVDYTFSGKGEFICYLTGHVHADYSGYLKHHPDQLFFTMPCSGCFPDGYHNIGEELSDLPRIPGTVTEDAVNVYVIDRAQKTVSVIRYGALINDLGEMRIFEKFRYENS